MKKNDISEALSALDEKFISESSPAKKKVNRKAIAWSSIIAAVLVIAVGVGAIFGGGTNNPLIIEAHAVYEAEYPKTAPYPKVGLFGVPSEKGYDAWNESRRERSKFYGAGKGLEAFFEKSTAEFLSGAGSENVVYSPLNVYMALAMLAEMTDGYSRAQILSLIGAKDIDSLREQAHAIWNANYSDDGAVTSILASSLWMNKDINFNENTLKTLAKKYYASSFKGTMGSADYTKAFQNWLNKQTGGLLKDQINGLELDPETVLALATTIYYRAKWDGEFSKSETTKDVFHSATGDVTCDFMHQTQTFGTYYWGDNFSAAAKSIEGSGSMMFILPDEGITPEQLLSDAQAMTFMFSRQEYENHKSIKINMAVPKFDVNSKTDLIDGLKNLGVNDVFSIIKSDFSPLTSDATAYVNKVEHGARVAIDEEGIVAAAYTAMMLAGSPMPPEDEVDFVLDRPFIFILTGIDGLPLFVGIVNNVN